MIEVKNIIKSFSNHNVLNNVSLEIKENEIVALQGPSGAGKTTLLKSIGLLDSIDSGKIIFNTKDITLFNEKQRCFFRNQEIGFVFQFHNLLPEFSGLENICMPSLIAGHSFKDAKNTALQLMEDLNIVDQKNKKPAQMSGGEQQRVAIARALINSPKLILADEPSGNLDSKHSQSMFKLFDEIRNRFNTTFLIITHNNKLSKICDRIIQIEDGEII
ncbi:MAG: lipoprotein-releasing system ATP-binding protein LolD [Flavobacteriales bacterium]|nr:lipoprotein-releasing system ATP-binding protein LolD [Flavobacteriales bacterium]|tara:strand:+ start:10059 stop:10709 length:651 start_codon:yes stop_codon:yes gene_type:complete